MYCFFFSSFGECYVRRHKVVENDGFQCRQKKNGQQDSIRKGRTETDEEVSYEGEIREYQAVGESTTDGDSDIRVERMPIRVCSTVCVGDR